MGKPDFPLLKAARLFIYHTVIGGMFFLIPLFVLVMLGHRLVEYVGNLSVHFIKSLGFGVITGVVGKTTLGTIVFLIVCFLAGLLANWSIAKFARSWLESTLKNIFPFYDYYKSLVEKKLKLKEVPPRPVVWIRSPLGWKPCVLIEQYENGEMVVFAPFSPKITDGEVYLVKPEDTKSSTLDEKSLNKVLLKQGKGLLTKK